MRGATASKLPEVFQMTPRKVSFSQGQCMAVSVLENGAYIFFHIDFFQRLFGF